VRSARRRHRSGRCEQLDKPGRQLGGRHLANSQRSSPLEHSVIQVQLRSHAVRTVLDGRSDGPGPQSQRNPLADLAPCTPLIELPLQLRQPAAAPSRLNCLARRFHRLSPHRFAMETEAIELATSLHADLRKDTMKALVRLSLHLTEGARNLGVDLGPMNGLPLCRIELDSSGTNQSGQGI